MTLGYWRYWHSYEENIKSRRLSEEYCIRISIQKIFWFAFGDVSLGNYESGKLEKYKYI